MRHRLLTYLLLLPLLCLAQVQTKENSIRVSTFLNAAGTDSITDITYYDELGRETGQVAVDASPTGKDIATLTEYDRFGRVERKWLPSPTPFANGKLLPAADFKESARKFYGDDCPFSKNGYERSPLDRVEKILGEGENWHSKDKAVRFAHAINCQDIAALNAIRFTVDKDGWNSLMPGVRNSGLYDNGSLQVTITTDEDGRRTYSFYDCEDRVVLIRNQLDKNSFCDTYYIYDARGNLLAVLPPLAADQMRREGTELDLSLELGELAYAYFYDDRGRCVAKKLPGKDICFYAYDTTDTPVLHQTPWLRERGLWAFEITDSWGRTCLAGTCKNKVDMDFLGRDPLPAVNARRKDNGKYFGYDIKGIELIEPRFTKISFYDDYLYLAKGVLPDDLARAFAANMPDGEEVCDTPRGLLTGSITAILGEELGDSSPLEAGRAIFQSFYYDYRERNVAFCRSNLLGGYYTERREYDYVGNLIERRCTCRTADNGDIEELYTYAYDRRGRLIDETHQLNGNTVRELAHNIYDDIGRLKATRRNKATDFSTTFNYNVRSWETEISSPRFKEQLFYEQPEDRDAKACYNGNVSVMRWGFETGSAKVSQMRSYRF